MKVYFVRHGESEHNAKNLHQGPDAVLSAKGREQAQMLSERLKHIDIDAIISSPFERAKQTAEIINNKLNKKIEYSPLFTEIRRPSEYLDKHYQDKSVEELRLKILEKYNERDFHVSDEENFFDFKKRAAEAVKFLEKRPEDNILVVTHGDFLSMLALSMALGDDIRPSDFLKLRLFLHPTNTGLSLIEYKEKQERWEIVTWNDLAHLAE